ncbi:transglutaminase domain-containing protein [Devosia rhizoryzae]|uniref:Transglutaminase family protein n=1 Tax=Devosia rhizoryzae TaxID=2774137 RepID=A0ABX7C4S8_9HYPH|nr:transglutaminase family protein [Devosia rhizoryzae]QQR38264.1 transglutaminase family protein [Devosia rhizoryzae]
MRIEIEHNLSLSLSPGSGQLLLHLLLTPGSGPTQTVESWSVEAQGIGNAGRFTDAYGNGVHLVNQGRIEGDVTVAARGVVVTRDTHGVLGRPEGEPVVALYKRVTPLTPPPAELLAGFEAGGNRLDMLHRLMALVGEPRSAAQQTQMQADGGQSQSQSQGEDPATAENLAHRFIGAARSLDIPARFVAGYLVGDDEHEGGLHAWAEAFDDRLGWIGFDPVLQLCATERHVRLAVGLNGAAAVSLRTVPVGEISQSAVVTGT